MMKKFFFIVALFFFNNSFTHDNYNYYASLNYNSFIKLESVNSIINVNDINHPLLASAIFHATNLERGRNGLVKFMTSNELYTAAQGHSKDMVEYEFFSHTSPVTAKRNMSDRLKAVGIINVWSAENIAESFAKKGQTYWQFAVNVVEQWMNSPGHRKNILNAKYKFLGCGTYFLKEEYSGTYLYFRSTQNFSSEY